MINYEVLIAFSYLIPPSISVPYILAMDARFYDLHSNIQAEPLPQNYSIILRISLSTLNIKLLNSLSFYQSFSIPIQQEIIYLNHDHANSFDCNIIKMNQCYEYKKKCTFILHIKSTGFLIGFTYLSHQLYQLIMQAPYTLNQKGNIYEYILSFFRIIDCTLLLFFTSLLENKIQINFKTQDFEEMNFLTLIYKILKKNLEFLPQSYLLTNIISKLYLIIFKRWNIVDDEVEIKLEIQILALDKQFNLKKTVSQIFQWHQSYIIENADYFDQNPNELLSLNFFQSKYKIVKIYNQLKIFKDNLIPLLVNKIQLLFHL
ncbi:unnamed protein product [Paramecium sonneborni]|uniref:Transmembrane protein n=1 Tax=Paramecium sonneborni TaxID=65129 RepID=A0A8S1MIV6_9CILI|nr:unnamed protein product [Paramecium sonneborni]